MTRAFLFCNVVVLLALASLLLANRREQLPEAAPRAELSESSEPLRVVTNVDDDRRQSVRVEVLWADDSDDKKPRAPRALDNYSIFDYTLGAELPPLPPAPAAVLNDSTAPLVLTDAQAAVEVTIGVLTVPALLRSRLIPLLETSLRHERDVMVFFEDHERTLPGRQVLAQYLASVGRVSEVHIVALQPLADMRASLRNAWVNLVATKHMYAARPARRWFAIVDDDTYLLMNAVRRIIAETETNATHAGLPSYVGTPLTHGVEGGWRVVRSRDGGRPAIVPSSARRITPFVCGGSGILMDRRALRRLHRVVHHRRHIDNCIREQYQPAGDVRLGACFQQAGVPIIPRREMFRDTVFRALGEKRQYLKYRFPASFHRFRRREWQYALGAVEAARGPRALVTWGDLLANFPNDGVRYWDSLFHPMHYENYTTIMGIRQRAANEMSKAMLRKERILRARGFVPRVATDEW